MFTTSLIHHHLPSRPSSSWNSQLPTVSRKELTTVACYHPARGSFSAGRSSQWEIQSSTARAHGRRGLMCLDRVGRVEGAKGLGTAGAHRLCVQPPCSPTCPAPLNTVGGGGGWTWQICPSPQEALLEGGCPG